MAIKLRRQEVNVTDELNKELELYGFSISFNPDDKKDDKKTPKPEKKDKTTKKMK